MSIPLITSTSRRGLAKINLLKNQQSVEVGAEAEETAGQSGTHTHAPGQVSYTN